MKNILKTLGLGFILTSASNAIANTLPPTPDKEADALVEISNTTKNNNTPKASINAMANSLPPTPDKEAEIALKANTKSAIANTLPPTPEKEAHALANTLPPTLECIAHYTTKIYINKQHVRC